MAAHVIVDLAVSDREKFKRYANSVQDTVKKYGGKYNCTWGYPETLKESGRLTAS